MSIRVRGIAAMLAVAVIATAANRERTVGGKHETKAGTPRRNRRKSRPVDWRAVQDSNLWPSAPEADALSI